MATDSSFPGLVILKTLASPESKRNPTTASCKTSEGIIEASFCHGQPPLPSHLFVHCPDRGSSAFREIPRILCMVDDLFLFRVSFARTTRCFVPPAMDYEYFIYRADPKRRLLKVLPQPYPIVFYVHQVGLLPRGDHYTVAALFIRGTLSGCVFELYLLDSEDGSSWRTKTLSKDFQIKSPTNDIPYFYHETDTVITLGGEGGTMGWVDLWRGILFCDVLTPDPALRFVPVPLSKKQIDANHIISCTQPYRGIAYIKGKNCLKFVELDVCGQKLPFNDDETGLPSVKVHGWSIKTYRNYKMTDSWDDWESNFTAEANKMDGNCVMHSEMLSQLLHGKASQSSEASAERTLQNLLVSRPALSMDDKEVVYLMARSKFQHPNTWVLAVDMENNTLQDVAVFDTQTPWYQPVIYCPGSVFTATFK